METRAMTDPLTGREDQWSGPGRPVASTSSFLSEVGPARSELIIAQADAPVTWRLDPIDRTFRPDNVSFIAVIIISLTSALGRPGGWVLP